jgi:hypothetical protein
MEQLIDAYISLLSILTLGLVIIVCNKIKHHITDYFTLIAIESISKIITAIGIYLIVVFIFRIFVI